MATTAPPLNPRQSAGQSNKGSKRVFRSISRFLSRGGEKQRPKLPHQSSSDPPPTLAATAAAGPADGHEEGGEETARTDSRSRSGSRSRSRESSPHLNGDGLDGDDGEPHLGPALSHRRRSGSLSNLSALSGADTDASIYPISPSTRSRPASSIISKRTAGTLDSASVASFAPTQGGSTYAKSYASTKPTTLLSVDSGGGANRIAVVPGTGSHFGQQGQQQTVLSTSAGTGSSSVAAGSPLSTSSGGPGITFTSLPASSSSPTTSPYAHHNPTSTSSSSPHRPSHPHRASTSSSSSSLSTDNLTPGVSPSLGPLTTSPDSPSSLSHPLSLHGGPGPSDDLIGAHAPPYTHAHPRNNPHPAQSPPDNASVLTLASSSFAPSFIGSTTTTAGGDARGGGGGGGRSSWTSTGGPALGLGGLKAWSTKQARSLGGGNASGKGRDSLSIVGGADEDASVRALAGSRRPSEESLGGRSTWSAVVLNNPSAGGGAEGDKGAAAGRGKERQMSVLSRETGEVDAPANGVEGDAEREGDDDDAHKERSRRRASSYGGSSLRHEVGAAAAAAEGEDEDRASDAEGEEGEEATTAATAAPAPAEEKGKTVAPEEHVGAVDAVPEASSGPSSAPAAPSPLDPAAPAFVPAASVAAASVVEKEEEGEVAQAELPVPVPAAAVRDEGAEEKEEEEAEGEKGEKGK
ncbi:hypothetical protein JCM6882_008009 [Rhodosporidiobolus microsporus]